jgi:hypothetical protein
MCCIPLNATGVPAGKHKWCSTLLATYSSACMCNAGLQLLLDLVDISCPWAISAISCYLNG